MRLSASKDLLSTASLDARRGAARAGRCTRCATRAHCCSTCSTRSSRNPGSRSCGSRTTFAEHPIWKAGLTLALEDTLGEIELLQEGLRLVRERIEGSTKLDEALAPLLNEMRSVTRRLQASGDGLRRALAPPPDDDSVRWIEVRGRERSVVVASVPLDLAPILREDLFRRLDSAIVTSATLTASNGVAADDGASVHLPVVAVGAHRSRSAADHRGVRLAVPLRIAVAAGDPERRAGAERRRGRTSPRGDAHRARRGGGVGRRAVRVVHEPSRGASARRPSCARAASSVAGRCSCTARRAAMRFSRGSARRGRRSCSARRRSGREWTFPATRCADS